MQTEEQSGNYCKAFVQAEMFWGFCSACKVPETPKKLKKSKHEAGKLIVLI